jgi:hypothetical protein
LDHAPTPDPALVPRLEEAGEDFFFDHSFLDHAFLGANEPDNTAAVSGGTSDTTGDKEH